MQRLYDKNDIDMIANHGYFEDWQRVMKPRLYTAEETVSGKSMLLRSYQSRGLLLGFIACYFLDREPSEIDYVLFKSFTDSAERFGGNIDGDGYTIFGLYFNGTAAGALIPYADIWGRDISFKNINISDSYISSSGYFVSALVGYIYGGTKNTVTYSKCYVSESVTIKTTSQYAGGLLGCTANQEDKYVIEDCAVLGKSEAKRS